jgi:hypothetical protein
VNASQRRPHRGRVVATTGWILLQKLQNESIELW